MKWYIVTGIERVEHSCDFVSVNTLKRYLWLKRNEITFKIQYDNYNDYYEAKRGILTGGIARRGKNIKAVKFIFK